jgi:hypothetical protein
MDITGRELPDGGVVGEAARAAGSVLRFGWPHWYCVIAFTTTWEAWMLPHDEPFASGTCTDQEDGDRQACAAIAAEMGWEEVSGE